MLNAREVLIVKMNALSLQDLEGMLLQFSCISSINFRSLDLYWSPDTIAIDVVFGKKTWMSGDDAFYQIPALSPKTKACQSAVAVANVSNFTVLRAKPFCAYEDLRLTDLSAVPRYKAV